MQRADLFDRPGLVGTRRWETPARAHYLLSPSAIHAKLIKPVNIESIFSRREKMRHSPFMPLNRRSSSLHLLFLHMARLHSGSDPTRPHPIPTPTPAYTCPPLPRIRPSGRRRRNSDEVRIKRQTPRLTPLTAPIHEQTQRPIGQPRALLRPPSLGRIAFFADGSESLIATRAAASSHMAG